MIEEFPFDGKGAILDEGAGKVFIRILDFRFKGFPAVVRSQ
jgi:hypothetical protein